MYDNFDSEIITVDELMEMIYIGKNTAYQLLNSGELRAFKIGKVWKIPKDAVSEYILTKQNPIPMNFESSVWEFLEMPYCFYYS